jgi:hypothetical protein
MKMHQGHVLIIVLVFLMIFSFMGLHSLIYTAEMIKTTHDKITKDNNLLSANQLLKQIENHLVSSTSPCMVPLMPAFMFAKKPLFWWQHYGCHGRFRDAEYYYVIEFLEKDSCGIIKEKQYNDNLAFFQRVTLCFSPRQSIVEKIILQSTIVKPIERENTITCPNRTRVLRVGRQTLRRL